MKSKRLIPLVVIVIILAAAGGGYWYYTNNSQVVEQTIEQVGQQLGIIAADTEGKVRASGFIETNQLQIVSETGGRIQVLGAEEGEPVSAGQPLVWLNTDLPDAQAEQIEAQIKLAEEKLAQIKAGVPQEQIAVATAGVTVAEANLRAAEQAWQDAIMLRDNPQQLNAQIDGMYSQITLAELQTRQASFIQQALEKRENLAAKYWDKTQEGIDWSVNIRTPEGVIHKSGHRDFEEGTKREASTEWNLATMQLWEAWVNYEQATLAHESARSKLYTLLALKENPLQANLQVTQAEANYQTHLTQVDLAHANLEKAKTGPSQTQIEVLEAGLWQAQSQLTSLEAQREKYVINAPIDGIVINRVAHMGEIAQPGTIIMSLADLDNVTLTVYVSASEYGRLQHGQTVKVKVDSYPAEVFTGEIVYIANEAEFTPKNVQTEEERVNLVYAIKIVLLNSAGKLKPGMPADAEFIDALSQ